MMPWLVAIPSYKRAECLKKRTLATLAAGGVPSELITVFVANETEAVQYRAVLDKSTYKDIVVAELGMHKVRNCITRHYANGQLLVQVDDDVRGVFELGSDGKALIARTDLVSIFDSGFATSHSVGARLWGMYPVCNAFYMYRKVTKDLRPIIGTLWGNVNDHSLPLLECPAKSDVERTLLYYVADGAVLRFNHLAPKQQAWTNPGGCQASGSRTLEISEAVVQSLLKRFPKFCTRGRPHKEGHAEVRLKDLVGYGEARLRFRGKF